MDEFYNSYTEQKKPNWNEYILCDSIYIKFHKMHIYL